MKKMLPLLAVSMVFCMCFMLGCEDVPRPQGAIVSVTEPERAALSTFTVLPSGREGYETPGPASSRRPPEVPGITASKEAFLVLPDGRLDALSTLSVQNGEGEAEFWLGMPVRDAVEEYCKIDPAFAEHAQGQIRAVEEGAERQPLEHKQENTRMSLSFQKTLAIIHAGTNIALEGRHQLAGQEVNGWRPEDVAGLLGDPTAIDGKTMIYEIYAEGDLTRGISLEFCFGGIGGDGGPDTLTDLYLRRVERKE